MPGLLEGEPFPVLYMIVDHSLTKVALTFTSAPWCRQGVYTWTYTQEEEVTRRAVSLTAVQRAPLALFLRHYFTAASLGGLAESCRRVGEELLALNTAPSFEKCWAQALVGINFIQDTLRNLSQATFFGEGTPADRKEEVLYLAPYEAWALHQAYDFLQRDLLPWFTQQQGSYPFCDAADLLAQLQPLGALLEEWQWLSSPAAGYRRIAYAPAEQIFS